MRLKIDQMVSVSHDMGKCSQCLECVELCPGKALSYHEGVFIHSPSNCTYCENCQDVCDGGAIVVKV